MKRVEILIADGDRFMSQVLRQTLGVMGLSGIHQVKNGEEAYTQLCKHPYDMLMTEWPMEPMDGLALLYAVRGRPEYPARAIPIIMLSGRAEKQDVEMARDAGVTEFLIKPFSPKSLYSKLELLIEQPRGFLLSRNYVGPDRRRRSIGFEGQDRRRSLPLNVLAENLSPNDDFTAAKLLAPDHALKGKIAVTDHLSKIITPEMLTNAQEVIESLSDEALRSIKVDLKHLEEASKGLMRSDANALKPFKDAALSIKSRAGTFGYHLTSEVARLLYRFVSSDYRMKLRQHNVILRKHIAALVVVIAGNVSGKEDEAIAKIIGELELLVARHRSGG